MMKADATKRDGTLHRELTVPQQNAIDLLVVGKTDSEAAEQLNVHRVTVTRWRLYHPTFQAALNRRRGEVWGAAADRLRALVPKALDVLAEMIEQQDGPTRLKAACAVLKLAKMPPGSNGIGPTDDEEIVRQVVVTRRKNAPGIADDLLEHDKCLPPMERHIELVRAELDGLANAPPPSEPVNSDTTDPA